MYRDPGLVSKLDHVTDAKPLFSSILLDRLSSISAWPVFDRMRYIQTSFALKAYNYGGNFRTKP